MIQTIQWICLQSFVFIDALISYSRSLTKQVVSNETKQHNNNNHNKSDLLIAGI